MSATLPELAVNRSFMAEFLAAEPSCFVLGLVEVGGTRCALVALRPEQSIPRHVTAGGDRWSAAQVHRLLQRSSVMTPKRCKAIA